MKPQVGMHVKLAGSSGSTPIVRIDGDRIYITESTWITQESIDLGSWSYITTTCPCGIHRADCEYHK